MTGRKICCEVEPWAGTTDPAPRAMSKASKNGAWSDRKYLRTIILPILRISTATKGAYTYDGVGASRARDALGRPRSGPGESRGKGAKPERVSPEWLGAHYALGRALS